jgi:small subunit ribosomal protein S4|tara:strand:- start:333 stop:947 length:615 start_codon:yes stop_codon:yes gene_type:complete
MGDPKKQRKKYSKPSHPWRTERIEEEKELLKEYGLKNKKEIWKIKSLLKKYFGQVKKIIAASSKQSDVEKKHLLTKFKKLKLIDESAQIEDVLNITPKDILDRRLQTIVFKKSLTRSIKHARQAIIHKHIVIGDKKITNSSYLVSGDEESKVDFASKSPFSNNEHPERVSIEEIKKKEPKTKKVKTPEKKDKKENKEKKNGNEK